MKITATQLEAAFAEWVKEFQRQAREEGEDGVVDFRTVNPYDWARTSTPYFWTLLKRAVPSRCESKLDGGHFIVQCSQPAGHEGLHSQSGHEWGTQ
jgi:hypothetical protein